MREDIPPVGLIYDLERYPILDLVERYFIEGEIRVKRLSGCLCLQRKEDLEGLSAIFFHLPSYSGENSCYPSMGECVDKFPKILFYFLDIFRRLSDSDLKNKSNVRIFNGEEGRNFVENPLDYFTRDLEKLRNGLDGI